MQTSYKMTAAEMTEIIRILNGRYKLCAERSEAERWYLELRHYPFSVVKEAVNDWIIHDGWKPEVVNIVERCKDVVRWREKSKAAAEDPNVKTVSCPYCHDRGLIIKNQPGGYTGDPCTHCLAGKKFFPWDFLSDEEKREYNEREIKAGRAVPKYHYAPNEYREAYLRGDIDKPVTMEEREKKRIEFRKKLLHGMPEQTSALPQSV